MGRVKETLVNGKVQCVECEQWYPFDDMNYHFTGTALICDDCYEKEADKINKDYEENHNDNKKDDNNPDGHTVL